MQLRSAWVFVVLLPAACGGGGQDRGAAAPAPSGRPSLGDPIAGTTVYDETGASRACEPPKASCPDARSTPEFRDQCRLAGFRIMQCGCDQVCTGDVKKQKLAYDANNKAKACAPAQADCSAPETSAAFQDACSESGHKFVVCGCEWLCAGPLRKPAAASPQLPSPWARGTGHRSRVSCEVEVRR